MQILHKTEMVCTLHREAKSIRTKQVICQCCGIIPCCLSLPRETEDSWKYLTGWQLRPLQESSSDRAATAVEETPPVKKGSRIAPAATMPQVLLTKQAASKPKFQLMHGSTALSIRPYSYHNARGAKIKPF